MLERTEKALRTRKGVQKKAVNLEIPLDLFEQIRVQAEKETRNISSQIVHILKTAFSQDQSR